MHVAIQAAAAMNEGLVSPAHLLVDTFRRTGQPTRDGPPRCIKRKKSLHLVAHISAQAPPAPPHKRSPPRSTNAQDQRRSAPSRPGNVSSSWAPHRNAAGRSAGHATLAQEARQTLQQATHARHYPGALTRDLSAAQERINRSAPNATADARQTGVTIKRQATIPPCSHQKGKSKPAQGGSPAPLRADRRLYLLPGPPGQPRIPAMVPCSTTSKRLSNDSAGPNDPPSIRWPGSRRQRPCPPSGAARAGILSVGIPKTIAPSPRISAPEILAGSSSRLNRQQSPPGQLACACGDSRPVVESHRPVSSRAAPTDRYKAARPRQFV